tara:strand:- start:17 stop:418 length:402 start_codon:yes stop_codon:yes gene_type:complete
MPSKIDLSEDSKVSLPAKNLLFILAAVAIGTFSYFNLLERLTLVETELQLISKDLEKANEFIDGVPKGDMVSPQINELFMLVEFLATNQEKLKENVEADMPQIQKVDMQVQFLEERIIDLETLVDKLRNNGTH